MRAIGTIFCRELKGYFNTPIAYIFVAILLALQGFLFFVDNPFFAINRAEMRGFFEWMPIVLFVFAPAVSMRLWSEELRVGTAEILLTLPYKVHELVLGKFFAAFVVLLLALAFCSGIPAAVAYFGDPDWGPIIGGYVGTVLMGAMFIALGAAVSSLTENQVVALLSGTAIGAVLVLVLSPKTAAFVATSSPFLGDAIGAFGVLSHFDAVERGVLSLGDLAYFVGGTIFFLAVNVFLVHSKRY